MSEDSQNRDNNCSGKPITIGNILWPLALSAYAIFRLTRPVPMPILSTVWYYVLAIIGGLLSIAALFGRKLPNPSQSAQQIDNSNRKIYAEVKHERRRVDENTIAEYRLDPGFYNTATAALQALRFSKVADYVDCHLEKSAPWMRSVLRAFLSSDGTVVGLVYNIRFLSWYRGLQLIGVISRDMRTTEFETELSDGSFVSTSNATDAGKTSEFPGLSRKFFPKSTPPSELYANHREHIREIVSERPGITPLVLRSFEDLCAASDRQNDLKSRHRNSPDFDPAAEIAKIAGKPLTAEQQEMARQAADLHAQRTNVNAN